ncbi:tandem-95 repeat protein, partial [Candidatus Poribacteria bacterium]|nr:tandem-95 repeat protein [Candidatus Poribacteria bacterium]
MKRASFTFVIVLSLMVASTVLGISARIFTVGGIVKKQDGAPVQGLEVTVVNETMGLVKRSKTGKSGEYAVIFIDYEGGIVVKTGDVIKVTVKDTEGNLLSESSHVVSEDEVKSAKTLINLTLNYPPALEPIEDKNVEEGKLLEFNVSATDPDEDKLVFSAEKLPKGATFKEGKFSWKPGFDQAGEYHVVFKVSDGKGGEDTKRVKITVTDVNRKPELSSIGARNIREGERLEFTVSAIDPDKDDLSFSAEGLPDGAKFEDGVFTWTPTYEQAGTYSITFIVSDGKGGRDIEKVEITVMDVNRPPELSPISDKSVKIGQVLEFTVEAIDPDRDELTFSAEGLPKGASFSNRKFSWQPSPAQIGEYYITFKVSDGKGGEDSEEVKITVLVSNYPPVLTPIGSKRVKEGETLQFTVEATDKDGDTLTFSAEGLPKGASFTDGKFSWTPSFDQAGTYHVTFKVSDGKDGQDSEKVEIIVEDVNRKPILETINAKSIKEGELLQFTLSATDPDGDSLIYSAEELPEGASFSDGKFSWKPTYDQAGIYHVTFKVSDGKGGEDSERVEITVKDVNRSPVLTAIGSKSVKEGETLEFILAASDPDKDNLVYSVEGLPEGASFIDGKFSWRPSYDQAGTYYVTFKVTDGKGGQDSEKVEIAVENVNRKPILKAIGTKSVKEGELLEFALSATDPDGDSLIYSAEGLPKGAILSDGKFSWKPSSEQIGEYHVTFKVSDGNGGEDSEDVRIIVGALNRSPVLAPIGSKSVREGEPLQFTVEADDEDGDALTFSAEGLPEGANFTEGKFSWKPGFEQSGEYLVTFKVSDGKGGEDSEQVKITVQDVNRDPILTSIEDKSVKEGELLRFQVSGSDPDGDPLTFSAEGLPKGAMFSNRWFNWKPDFSQSGIYHVTFKISDGKGGEDSERVEITVKDVNRNPVLAAIGSKGVKEGETLEFILSASDPDKDNLVYSAEELPKGASFIGRKFSWTPDFDQAGEYLVTFKVSDGRGGEDSEQVRITVQDANRKPKIADIGDKSVKEGELLQFTVNGYDPDGDPLTFSAENLPKGAAFLNRRFIWRPKPDQVGVHKIIFKVSDGKGGEDATVVKITVIDVSPPLISHTPLEPQKAGEKVVISAEVKDFSELKSVKLLYRAGGESEIKSVEMRRKGELFSAEVEMPQTGLIYCIIAEDLAGNKTIFPKNGIRNPIGVPAIGDFKMKGEMTNRTFHMISIPLVGVTS